MKALEGREECYLGRFDVFVGAFHDFILGVRVSGAQLGVPPEKVSLDFLGKVNNLLLETPSEFLEEQVKALEGVDELLPELSISEATDIFKQARVWGYSVLHPEMDLASLEGPGDSPLSYDDFLLESDSRVAYYRWASKQANEAITFSDYVAW